MEDNTTHNRNGDAPQDPPENSDHRIEELTGLGNLSPRLRELISRGGPTTGYMACETCEATADERRAVGCMGGGSRGLCLDWTVKHSGA